jgi:K(+)-stimulated pyrophosphate-energized sodium pump
MQGFDLLWLAPIGSILALGFSGFLTWVVLRQDRGTEKMKEIANAVKEGALAYIKRQYMVVGIFFAVVFCILFFLHLRGYLVIFVPFAFITEVSFPAFRLYRDDDGHERQRQDR